MRIVIAGAGDIGFHLARLLVSEKQDIVLIDMNKDVLDYAESHLDVSTLHGDATSPSILESADILEAELFLAVTTGEHSNIVSCILAKQMGCKQTIARVVNEEYLSEKHKQKFFELGIDKLISPIKLAVSEISRLLEQCEVTDIFQFEEGRISLAGINLDDDSHIKGKTIERVIAMDENVAFNPIAILRGNKTIIPRKNTRLKRNDHLYFLTEGDQLTRLLERTGKTHIKVRNIMILGGSALSLATVKVLEENYNVTIIEQDKNRSKKLTEELNNALIIHGNTGNFELLKEEGIENMDVFLALTENSETNILTSLMADELGVYKTIALVDNSYYTRISQNIGVDTMINMKIIAANNIFRFIRKGTVEAITSLHGVDAEVIEYVISKKSKITKKAIRKLNFPKGMVVGAIIRDNNIIIPDGDTVFFIDDKIIILALPRAIQKLERIFGDD
jgi:trk system potassium uptake protein TrkA